MVSDGLVREFCDARLREIDAQSWRGLKLTQERGDERQIGLGQEQQILCGVVSIVRHATVPVPSMAMSSEKLGPCSACTICLLPMPGMSPTGLI